MKHLILFVAFALPSSALAGDGAHCHARDVKGGLIDLPNFTTARECQNNGGFWLGHGPHCDVQGGDGLPAMENPRLDSPAKCSGKGGRWHEHGHEKHKL